MGRFQQCFKPEDLPDLPIAIGIIIFQLSGERQEMGPPQSPPKEGFRSQLIGAFFISCCCFTTAFFSTEAVTKKRMV
jgi:hypothetical protein